MDRANFESLFTRAQFQMFVDNELSNQPGIGGCPETQERFRRLMATVFRPALARMIQSARADNRLVPVTCVESHDFPIINHWNKACAHSPKSWIGTPWKELAKDFACAYLVRSIMEATRYPEDDLPAAASTDAAYDRLVTNVTNGDLFGRSILIDTFCRRTGARADLEMRGWSLSFLSSSKGIVFSDVPLAIAA